MRESRQSEGKRGVNEWVTDLLANGVVGGLVSYRTSSIARSHIKSPIVILVEVTNSAAQEIPNYFSINNFTSVIHLRYLKDRQGS
jgi:hypothetical protein